MIDIESLEDSVPTRHRQCLANDRKLLVCGLRYWKVFLLMFFLFQETVASSSKRNLALWTIGSLSTYYHLSPFDECCAPVFVQFSNIYIYMCVHVIIWRLPKVGLPPNHPFFIETIQLLGIPDLWKPSFLSPNDKGWLARSNFVQHFALCSSPKKSVRHSFCQMTKKCQSSWVDFPKKNIWQTFSIFWVTYFHVPKTHVFFSMGFSHKTWAANWRYPTWLPRCPGARLLGVRQSFPLADAVLFGNSEPPLEVAGAHWADDFWGNHPLELLGVHDFLGDWSPRYPRYFRWGHEMFEVRKYTHVIPPMSLPNHRKGPLLNCWCREMISFVHLAESSLDRKGHLRPKERNWLACVTGHINSYHLRRPKPRMLRFGDPLDVSKCNNWKAYPCWGDSSHRDSKVRSLLELA